MEKKLAARNIFITMGTQIVVLALTFVTRMFFVRTLGVEANGLYALFISVFGFLSVLELGFASAITYNLYKPIVEQDYDSVSALYYLCRKIFRYVVLIMGIIGLVLIPLIPFLATGHTGEFNIYLNFSLFLVSALLPFLVIHKVAFIDAHKKNHITRLARSGTIMLQMVLQLVSLYLFQSFEIYLGIVILTNGAYVLLIYLLFKSKFSFLLTQNNTLTVQQRRNVIEKTRAQFMHRIGGLLVFTLTNVLISSLISVLILGYYSNYMLIANSTIELVGLFFVTLLPFVGHAYESMDSDGFEKLFQRIYTLSVILGTILFMGYFAIIDNLIGMLFGDELIMERMVIIVITISCFITFLRRVPLLFSQATGAFYYDRYKPFIEGILNIGLAVLFIFQFGVIGPLMATIITDLLINHVIEPFVIFKYSIKKKSRSFYVNSYLIMGLFVGTIFLLNYLPIYRLESNFIAFLINGFTSIGISFVFLLLIYLLAPIIRKSTNGMVLFSINWLKRYRSNKAKGHSLDSGDDS